MRMLHTFYYQTHYWASFYANQQRVTFYPSHKFSNCSPHTPNEGKLFNFLFERSKSVCNWVTVIDVDEYIFPSTDLEYETINQKYSEPFIKALLKNHVTHPIVRMPWYIMSSHGFERRPNGLVTNNFYEGIFQNTIKMKTLIRSSYVVSWTDSHHPLKFSWFSPKIGGKTLREYNRPFLVQPHEMTYRNDCLVPRSPLLVRHYRSLSWEDFRAIRMNRTHTSFGGRNLWADNPRRKWLEFNFSSSSSSVTRISRKFNTSIRPHCYRLADSFRLKMVVEVEQAARRRLNEYRKQQGIYFFRSSESDYSAWLHGKPLAENLTSIEK